MSFFMVTGIDKALGSRQQHARTGPKGASLKRRIPLLSQETRTAAVFIPMHGASTILRLPWRVFLVAALLALARPSARGGGQNPTLS